MIEINGLKQRADFLRLRHGSRFITPYFIMRAMPSVVTGQAGARVGYTVTTKCGNAVVRNRIKRRFRALVAEVFPTKARAGYDYLLVASDKAQPGAAEVPFRLLHEALVRAIKEIRH